ncbi:MAG: Na-K-Cl cotransporter [Alphaproteobacteria bacterium]|nr:Na-K-Cl cotransporter [Alphaproteobacteria bacterium]
MSEPTQEAPFPKQGLGTFIGVFTPTILTILGAIMYLRLGWVVSQAGLWGTIAIVVIANTITLFTALSMSTLATNMRVGVGGAYYLISRSFGLEVGGAIGIPLFLSQVLSLAMYAYALAEVGRLISDDWPIQITAALIVLGVTAVAARSTELALKAQLPILVFITISILALFAGADFGTQQVPDIGSFEKAGFWEVFAVFFPAVTGILTGLSLSGDLEEPSQSIPRGGLFATLTGFAIYLALPFALAFGAGPTVLADSMAWTYIAVGGTFTVILGLATAILSSAIGSVLSAPRTLQALATDRMAPSILAEVDPESGEPMKGLYLTGFLAFMVVVLTPSLDYVASLVTMFFLTTYGALNVVAALEAVIGDTSFRPTLRVHWLVSLAGALGCIVAMFAISPGACLLAIFIEIVIFFVLSRRSLTSTFGDARSGLMLTGARYALMMLRHARVDPRNWRPHILVFTTDLHRTLPVVKVADAFGQHRGIVTVEHLVDEELDDFEGVENLLRTDNAMLEAESITAFCEVTCVSDLDQGAVVVAQANGMAGLHSNTVMFGYHRDDDGPEHLARLIRLCRTLSKLEKCSVLFVPTTGRRSRKGSLVVWWTGRENNGDLMLLLAHLTTLTSEYAGARIVLKTIVDDERAAVEMKRDFASMLPTLRMDVAVEVIVREGGESIQDVIHRDSQGARMVFLGMALPDDDASAYARKMDSLLDGLPDTCLVRNAGPFRGRLV